MDILIACERSGIVRDAFIRKGHNAMSCDIAETEQPGPHYKGDVRDILSRDWDMVIAHPECTFLCGSGWHWVARGRIESDGRPRIEHVTEALAFAKMFIDGPETAHIPLRGVENPIGKLSTLVRKPDQIIQPYQFGDDASKATCLWLHGLPLLNPTKYIQPRLVCCGKVIDENGCQNCQGSKKARPRWANQTDSGQNALAPSPDRSKERSKTYSGIAEAMAGQWGV